MMNEEEEEIFNKLLHKFMSVDIINSRDRLHDIKNFVNRKLDQRWNDGWNEGNLNTQG